MKYVFLPVILSFIALASFSQSTGVEGRVLDENHNPITNANVIVNNSNKGTYTKTGGLFKLKNLAIGNLTLTISKVGYKRATKSIYISKNRLVYIGDLILKSDNQSLKEVIVRARMNDYAQKTPSSSLRLASKLVELPQNIQIVGKGLIQDQLSFSLFDGISRNISGTRRVLHQTTALIYMRGYPVKGLRNGMNISGYFGPMKDDISFVERFEFVKGPAGFMIGNTSLGGLYNVVTKKPNGSGQKSVALTLGSFDTYRAELDIDGNLSKDKKLLYRLNLMGKLQGSHIDYGYENGYVIAPSFRYLPNDNTQITLEYIYQNNDINSYANYIYSKKRFKEFPVNTSYSDPRKDPINLNEHNIILNFQHNLSKDWKFTAQASYIKFMHRGTQLNLSYNSLQDDGSATRSFSLLDNDNTILSGQIFINGKFNTGNIEHKVLGGLDMGSKEYFADWSGLTPKGKKTAYNIYNPQAGVNNLKTNDFPVIDRSVSLSQRSGSYSQKNTYSALYLYDQLSFFDNKLRLSLAGRFTTTKRFERTGKLTKNEVFTPRVGLSYSFMQAGSLYGVFDQTFEENYGLPLKNGDALKPSKGTNIEFGIKKDWFNKTLQTSLSVYQLTKNNITTSAGTPPDNMFSEQIGESRSRGIELDITGKLLPNLNLVVNSAFTEAKIIKDKNPKNIGSLLPGSAKYISNAWLNYAIPNRILKGVSLSLGFQWQGSRVAWPPAGSGNGSDDNFKTGGGNFLPDDYFSLDGGVSYKQKKFEISMLVNNITDNYNYTGFLPGAWGYKHYGWASAPPTNFRVQLRYFF